jgi:hypothetical protein
VGGVKAITRTASAVKNIVFKIAKNGKMESLQKMIERTLVCLCICVNIFVVGRLHEITNHKSQQKQLF